MTFRSASVPAAILAAAAVLGTATGASAGIVLPSIVLTVDTSNPAAVVIASTGGPSAVSNSGQGYAIHLLGVLSTTWTGPQLTGVWPANQLTAANGRTYGSAFSPTGSTLLEIYGGNQVQAFTQGQAAFAGSATTDLSWLPFAAPGTTGNVVIRDDFGNTTGVIIGRYQIIPAPGAAAVLGLGGLLAARRRR